MRPFISLIFIFLCLGTLLAEENSTPFLSDLLKGFPGVRDLALSEKEAYFTAQSLLNEVSVIMVSHKVFGKWRKPNITPFSGTFMDVEPFLTPDGKRLYFASNRPLSPSETETKDYDLWYVERDKPGSEWSQAINLGQPVNTENNEFYPALTSHRNLYFTSDGPPSEGKDNIFYSSYRNGSYSNPVSLSDSINSPGYEFNAFVAPDESYLIFSGYNRPDGLGSADLYISYRRPADNSWTKAMNLGSTINSKQMDYCPFVDEKSQMLYFTSRRSDVAFPSSGFEKTDILLDELNKSSNGLSRLYQVPFSINQ